MKPVYENGFTLIEILMVVVLIAVISAVSLPQFINFRDDAKNTVTKDRMNSIRGAITGDTSPNKLGYISHMGTAPASLLDLAAKGTQSNYDPINKIGWNGPYLDATVTDWNKDAWGTDYQYSASNRSIRSCGANKVCGDSDDIVVTF